MKQPAPLPKKAAAEGLNPYIVESIRQRQQQRLSDREQLRAIQQAADEAGIEADSVDNLVDLARKSRAERAARLRRYRREAVDRTRLTGAKVERIDPMTISTDLVCYLCGLELLPEDEKHLDHVVPLSRGGSHTADNLRATHAFCNLSKGAKTVDEWRAVRDG